MVYRGVKMIRYGWDMYSQQMILNSNPQNIKYVLLDHINSYIMTIVDIGLNYKGGVNLSVRESVQFMKQFTIRDEKDIQGDINHTLSNPTEKSLTSIGYHFIMKMMLNLTKHYPNKKKLHGMILRCPLDAYGMSYYMTAFVANSN